MKLTHQQELCIRKLADRLGVDPETRLDEIISDEYMRTFRPVETGTECPTIDKSIEDDYYKDKRDYETFSFMGNTIYRAYNIFTPHVLNELEEEIDDALRTPNKWDRSVEVTQGLSARKLKYKVSWFIFFSEIKRHLHRYAKLTNNKKILEYKIASYWAKRMKGNTEEDYEKELYINYRNTHKHEDFDLGMIFYLNNPSRIYGTLIENDNKEIILPGDENSLLIHHSHINHSPVMPQPIVANKAHRCVIVIDFKHESKL
tara:strand:+ start:3314 stop:4090 length:777 start_codon:yes stop_codon:yes gene_type:complete